MTNLRRHRTAAGLSQKAVAIRVGLSRQQYINVEKGRVWPRLETSLALAALFGVTVEELFHEPAMAANE